MDASTLGSCCPRAPGKVTKSTSKMLRCTAMRPKLRMPLDFQLPSSTSPRGATSRSANRSNGTDLLGLEGDSMVGHHDEMTPLRCEIGSRCKGCVAMSNKRQICAATELLQTSNQHHCTALQTSNTYLLLAMYQLLLCSPCLLADLSLLAGAACCV